MNEQAESYIRGYDSHGTNYINITAEIAALEDESETIRADMEEQAINESATATGVASLKRKKLASHDRYQEILIKIKGLKIDAMHAEKGARTCEMNAWNSMDRIH